MGTSSPKFKGNRNFPVSGRDPRGPPPHAFACINALDVPSYCLRVWFKKLYNSYSIGILTHLCEIIDFWVILPRGYLGVILGPFLGLFWAYFGPPFLGPILGPILGLFWGLFWTPFWTPFLDLFWTPFWAHFGPILGVNLTSPKNDLNFIFNFLQFPTEF